MAFWNKIENKKQKLLKLPENIDLNYKQARELFGALCTYVYPSIEGPLGFGQQFYNARFKGSEVRLYPPRISESEKDRKDIQLLGVGAEIPKLVLNVGSKENFDELIKQFENRGIVVETSVKR